MSVFPNRLVDWHLNQESAGFLGEAGKRSKLIVKHKQKTLKWTKSDYEREQPED